MTLGQLLQIERQQQSEAKECNNHLAAIEMTGKSYQKSNLKKQTVDVVIK